MRRECGGSADFTRTASLFVLGGGGGQGLTALPGAYVGRLAPSPTGALHLGNVRTFMIAWLRARSLGGKLVMRMEDLDHPRDKPGAAAGAIADLRWLGFDWDEEYVQSERRAIYREALGRLRGDIREKILDIRYEILDIRYERGDEGDERGDGGDERGLRARFDFGRFGLSSHFGHLMSQDSQDSRDSQDGRNLSLLRGGQGLTALPGAQGGGAQGGGAQGPLVYPCVCSRRDVENAQSAPHEGEQLHYPGTCRGRFGSWEEAVEFLRAVRREGGGGQGLTALPGGGGGQGLTALPGAGRREGGGGQGLTALPGAVRRGYLPAEGCLRSKSLEQCAPLTVGARMPCWRFRVDEGVRVAFDDVFAGHYEQDVAAVLGDFPVARDPDGAGYTLAVVVDDAAMGVTEVVRGDDLLAATPAQILLQRALGLPTPAYCHVPLVVGPDGKRLAKRHGDTRVSAYREAGKSPEELLGYLAASCGWAKEGERVTLRDLLPRFDLSTIPHRPFMI